MIRALTLLAPMRRVGRFRLAAWVSASTALGVLGLVAFHDFNPWAIGDRRLLNATIFAVVVLGMLRLGGRTPLYSDVASALAAGAGATLGAFAMARWGWDVFMAHGLVPNYCNHRVGPDAWIALVALASGAITLVSTLIARNPTIAIAIGTFSAPVVAWWTQSAGGSGCG